MPKNPLKIKPNHHLPTRPQNVAGALKTYAGFIRWDIKKLDDAKGLLGALSDLEKDVNFPDPKKSFSCVCGLSDDGFGKVFGKHKPKGLIPMPAINGEKHQLVVGNSDGFFHIRAERVSEIETFLKNIEEKFPDAIEITNRIIGYTFAETRDWLGFVDGTANPDNQPEIDACTLIQDDEEKFKKGSFLVFQTYIHDVKAWDKKKVEEQEDIIGRTKLENVQQDNQKSNSHIVLNTIVVDGVEMDILRDNTSFTTEKGEKGTAFVGYAAQPAVTLQMLTNMFVGKPEGNYDRILDFSKNTFSCLYFCPTKDALDSLGG